MIEAEALRQRGPGTMIIVGRIAQYGRGLFECRFQIHKQQYYEVPIMGAAVALAWPGACRSGGGGRRPRLGGGAGRAQTSLAVPSLLFCAVVLLWTAENNSH